MTPEQHIDQVRELAELKGKVSDMAQDVTKIVKQMDMVWELQRDQARIQEQILDGRESVRRAFERIERNEEASGTMKENTEKWINRGIGAWFVGATADALAAAEVYIEGSSRAQQIKFRHRMVAGSD
jgi:hypothetical protein